MRRKLRGQWDEAVIIITSNKKRHETSYKDNNNEAVQRYCINEQFGRDVDPR